MSSARPSLIPGEGLEHEAFRHGWGALNSIPSGILDRLTWSLGYEKLDLEERGRRLVAFLLVIMTTPALFGACGYYLSKGRHFTAFSILLVALSFCIVPVRLRSVRDAKNVYRVNVALIGLLFLHLFYISSPHGHPALWLYLFPMPCFFQLGKQEGLLYSLILCASCLIVYGIYDLLLGSPDGQCEAGKLELKSTEVDIRKLLSNLITMLKEKALKHRVSLAVDCDGIPKVISADEQKLKQVMYNLLSNAVKFTPDGGSVRVTANRHTAPHGDPDGTDPCSPEPVVKPPTGQADWILVSVSDTGIGVKKEDMEKIFAPFEQSDLSASRRFEGTGLGLTLSRRFVELHGGRIWAESEGEGKGSVFRFVLPVQGT